MKVAVFGFSGYLGAELIKILDCRKDTEIIQISTREKYLNWDRLRSVVLAFLALPANESMHLVPKLLSLGIKVIDLSGAYRLKDPNQYPVYYGFEHAYPNFLKEAVYGLPENNREAIRRAWLIANPGCYATAINLGLLPLTKNGLISKESKVIVSATSGYTGAGRGKEIPKVITPYKSKREHQHVPEVEQELGIEGQLLLYPEIGYWPRGIEATIEATLLKEVNVANLYKNHYSSEAFVWVKSVHASISNVLETNFCYIIPEQDGSFVKIRVVIDNLIKGGAGQAVQSLNIIFGHPDNFRL